MHCVHEDRVNLEVVVYHGALLCVSACAPGRCRAAQNISI